MRTPGRLRGLVSIGVGFVLAACGQGRPGGGSPAAPVSGADVRQSARPGAPMTAPAAASPRGSGPGPVPAVSIDIASLVPFPPRDEPFTFRQQLEVKYRDGLRRGLTSTFTDVEGEVVWTQEYLRYRVNGCSHPDAIQRVFEQIDGGPARPVCADLPGGIVPFPPRNESFAFRQDLEVKYRDGLKRGPTSTYVDMEGSLVWTQEYLRYRVNACGHVAGTAKVFQQIDGGPIAPVCMDALSGLWHGESDYINAPFTADLLLSGTRVSGVYRDQKDQGSIGGTYTGGEDVTLQVNFGDTGFTMEGEFDGPNRIRGTFRVAVLGNRLFHFEMTR